MDDKRLVVPSWIARVRPLTCTPFPCRRRERGRGQMSACEGADGLASAVLDVNGALLAHGPAVHKLNELYATWFALPETQQLASGLLCLLYTSPSPRDRQKSRMPSSA